MSDKNTIQNEDEYELNRFIKAQANVYQNVLTELNQGKKTSHWMWFIFPQIKGLGNSETSVYYSIKSMEEATAYLKHPELGVRLIACCDILLTTERKSAHDIFGFPDARKLQSGMTLFSMVPDANSVFSEVLKKYFNNEKDQRTIDIVQHNNH